MSPGRWVWVGIICLGWWGGGVFGPAWCRAQPAISDNEPPLARICQEVAREVDGWVREQVPAPELVSAVPPLSEALRVPSEENLDSANAVLDSIALRCAADICFLLNADGLVICSSNRLSAASCVGKNFAFRPYFQDALQGKPGMYFALGTTSGTVGFYYGYPIFSDSGEAVPPIGVVVVKRSLAPLSRWLSRIYRDGIVAVIGPQDIVVLSNVRTMQFYSLWQLTEEQRRQLRESRQFGDGPWPWTGLRRVDEGTAEDTMGVRYRMRQVPLPGFDGWSVVALEELRQNGALQHPDRFIVHVAFGSIALAVALSVFLLFFSRRYRV